VPFTLLLNSIGHPDPSCRQGYVKLLTEFLGARRDELAPEDRARIDTNPLRTFDSKLEQTRALMAEAPLISDHLCAECREHFSSVTALLDELDVGYTLEPRLVRGLDYYSRTAFEYIGEGLGSQDAVGGGGRYDGLAETLGGPRLPGVGFALGVDRILVASSSADEDELGAPLDVYVVALGPEAARAALRVVTALRRRGLGADLDHAGRGLRGQMRDAARSGARWAVVLGEAELASGSATLRDLDSGEQSTLELRALEESWTP
jgi:histidyl-tRNA synthetase